MSIVTDLEVIDPVDLKQLMDVKGEILLDIVYDGVELTLLFEKRQVTVSRQYSEAYGDNIFWQIDVLKKKYVAIRDYYRKTKHGATKVRAHLRYNKVIK